MSTTKEKTITTEAEAIKLLKKDHGYLRDIPYKLRTKKVCDLAYKQWKSTNTVENIPLEHRTFTQVYRTADSYGKYTGESADLLNEEWGISRSGFIALVKKGTMPNMKKVPEKYKEEIELICFRKAFNENGRIMERMPENVIRKLFTGNLERIIEKNGPIRNYSSSWIGDELIGLVPEDMVTKDDIKLLQKKIKEQLSQEKSRGLGRGGKCFIGRIPEQYVTDELYELALDRDPSDLRDIPKERITKKMCDIAVSADGNTLKHVPEELKKDYYVKTVKSGKGLHTIPEEDRTEKLCMIAFDKNHDQFKYVPEDKRSYAMCLSAVDDDCRRMKDVPVEHQDEEMVTRFIMSIFRKTYKKDHGCERHLTDARYDFDTDEESQEALLTLVFDRFFEHPEGNYKRKDELKELMKDIMQREPRLYSSMVFHSGDLETEDRRPFHDQAGGFKKYFGGITCFELAEVAAKNDISVVKNFKGEYQEKVWTAFLKNK